MKRIRYELSLDYENGIEKMLSMLDMGNISKALEPKGKFPIKIEHVFTFIEGTGDGPAMHNSL